MQYAPTKRREHGEGNERIVGEITEVEQLAPHLARQPTAHLQRGLAAEEGGIGGGEHVVEVGEDLAKFVGVGIPVAQECERVQIAQEERVAVGAQAVKPEEQRHAAEHEGAPREELPGVAKLAPEQQHEGGGEERVDQRDPFDGQKPGAFFSQFCHIDNYGLYKKL